MVYNDIINTKEALKGVLNMSVLQTIDLKKYYGAEPNITRALDGVNISVEDGELWLLLELPAVASPPFFT